jgi:hypothetical protein
MITFLIAVAALGVALYTLKKFNDCPCWEKKECSKKDSCLKEKKS